MIDFISAPWSIELMHWTLRELAAGFIWLFILYIVLLYIWKFLEKNIDSWIQLIGLLILLPILMAVWDVVIGYLF